jgi:hypothetical protein
MSWHAEPDPCAYCKVPMAQRAIGEPDNPGAHAHSYCMLLRIVGHDVGLCNCTDYEGMSQRAAAIESAARFNRMETR